MKFAGTLCWTELLEVKPSAVALAGDSCWKSVLERLLGSAVKFAGTSCWKSVLDICARS